MRRRLAPAPGRWPWCSAAPDVRPDPPPPPPSAPAAPAPASDRVARARRGRARHRVGPRARGRAGGHRRARRRLGAACSRRSTSTSRSILRPTRSYTRRRPPSRRSTASTATRRRSPGKLDGDAVDGPLAIRGFGDPSLVDGRPLGHGAGPQGLRGQARRGRHRRRPALLRRADDAARLRAAAQRVGRLPRARERGRARRELRHADRAPHVARRRRARGVRSRRGSSTSDGSIKTADGGGADTVELALAGNGIAHDRARERRGRRRLARRARSPAAPRTRGCSPATPSRRSCSRRPTSRSQAT